MGALAVVDYKEDKLGLNHLALSEDIVFADRDKIDKMNAGKMTEIMDDLYEKAIDGIPKVSRSVSEMAGDYLSRYDDVQSAAKALINYQIAKCGTSGFISGLGGIVTMPVAIPANVGSVLYVQIRMIAAIAQMGGFNIKSDQVQTFVYACLTGTAVSDIMKQTGMKIGQKITESAIKGIPEKILAAVNRKVGFCMISKFGTSGTVNLVKLVPVAGGVVAGAIDVASTKVIAENAISIFLDRKVPKEKKSLKDQVSAAAKTGLAGAVTTKNKVSSGLTSVSTTIKTKCGKVLDDTGRVKMSVLEVVPDKLTEGKMCHVIRPTKKVLLSWDYFVDANGNKYAISNAVGVPTEDKKNSFVYYAEFEDDSILLPKNTVLYAGEDKWRKKLPKSDIDKITYYVAKLSLEDIIDEEKVLGPDLADIEIELTEKGALSIKRKNSKTHLLKYKVSRIHAESVIHDIKVCISDRVSRPFAPDDDLTRRLVLTFQNGKEVAYDEIRGPENGATTRDIISNLLKEQGLNIKV